jgi:SAM-dependent methyltransferase
VISRGNDVSNLTTRKRIEREFHNARFDTVESDNRTRLDKWYHAACAGMRAQDERVLQSVRGARALEYGCADGRLSLLERDFARAARQFHGIDISDRAIEHARETAARLGHHHCRFDVMDAEQLAFDDGAFDVVYGRGILHHLDLERAFLEIQRVLAPGGSAIFYEPMGHNPLINRFRQLTPDLRTPDEHPLLVRDFELARHYFARVETRYFGLTTLGAVAITQDGPRVEARSSFASLALMRACEAVDDWVLQLPGVGPNAWMVLLTMRK